MTSEPRVYPLHPGGVVVHYGGRRWTASPGDVITLGRSRSCRVQLPEDDHLSRRAGSLRVLDDCLLIRNDSQHKPLVIRPPYGEDRIVEPGAATSSLPFTSFDIVLAGSAGTVVLIRVDASRLTSDSVVSEPETQAPATATEPIQLSKAQRRVLAALCAPLLSEAGPKAAPATYAQIGRRLDRQPQYIRNVLKSLRESLAGYGVQGLTPDEASASHEDFRWSLARWGIRSGWITAADIDRGDDDDSA